MKILVITQHIFPIQTPRSIRSTELIKELSRRGNEVTVYAVLGKYDYSEFEKKYGIHVKQIPVYWEWCPTNSDGKGKRSLFDKINFRIFKRLEFPLFEFYYRVPQLLKNESDFDVLISIGVPHHIHWGCAHAKRKYSDKFPKVWIADCGDPFMENGKTKNHLSHFEKYERMFCEACDYITVPIKEAFDAYYPEYRDKIRVIPQGFDFDLNANDVIVNNKVPTFAYAGMFYPDIRNPKLFLDYLSSVEMDFRFYIFTRFDNLLADYRKKMEGKMIIQEPLPREELINKLRTMDFLVNISNLNKPCQLPSKLIDYGIAGRPILDVNPQKINTTTINAFLHGDYSSALKITNLEDYHIRNVVDKFEHLINSSSKI